VAWILTSQWNVHTRSPTAPNFISWYFGAHTKKINAKELEWENTAVVRCAFWVIALGKIRQMSAKIGQKSTPLKPGFQHPISTGHGHTHFYTFFNLFSFFPLDPQKSEKDRGHTRKSFQLQNIFHFLIQTPQVHFSLFFTLGENKGWSQEDPREGPNHARPLETPCLGFCTSERTLTGRISEETRFPYMVYTHDLGWAGVSPRLANDKTRRDSLSLWGMGGTVVDECHLFYW